MPHTHTHICIVIPMKHAHGAARGGKCNHQCGLLPVPVNGFRRPMYSQKSAGKAGAVGVVEYFSGWMDGGYGVAHAHVHGNAHCPEHGAAIHSLTHLPACVQNDPVPRTGVQVEGVETGAKGTNYCLCAWTRRRGRREYSDISLGRALAMRQM